MKPMIYAFVMACLAGLLTEFAATWLMIVNQLAVVPVMIVVFGITFMFMAERENVR
jgi:ABC-type uncharacterized transport system permease subunit